VARYLPIAEHGLIGDLHTVALVATDGTIDWYCCPRFDSPNKPSGARAAQFVCRNDARATFWRIGPPARARTAVSMRSSSSP
jgi:GH15 family glucan-1,4-alpha-glucosidase